MLSVRFSYNSLHRRRGLIPRPAPATSTRATAPGYIAVIALLALALGIVSEFLFAPAAAAETGTVVEQQLGAAEDAVVTSEHPLDNYGDVGVLAAGTRPSSDAIGVYYYDRSLLRFDLSSLPAGVIIDSAVLELYQESSGGSSALAVGAFPIVSEWTESTVTWSSQPAVDLTRGMTTTVGEATGYVGWDITEIARDWYHGTGTGVMLRGPELPFSAVRMFQSKEPTEYVPRLTLTYHTPPPTPDLILAELVANPNPAFPAEDVELRALVLNDSDVEYSDLPVHFYIDDDQVAVASVPLLQAHGEAYASAPITFPETGAFRVRASVDPDHTYPDANPDNNSASLFQAVVIEKYPIWSKPDLALEALAFDPARPDPGQPVVVHAEVHNVARADIIAVLVALFVDGEAVDEIMIGDIPAGGVRPFELQWSSAQPGRHWLNLVIDPEMTLEERSKANNEAGEWLRVAGAPGARADLEVSAIRIADSELRSGAAQREDLQVEIDVHNAGYVDVRNLPIEVLVDGAHAADGTLAGIEPGANATFPVKLLDPGLGHHIITARLDPERTLELDLLQRDWARDFTFPTPDFDPFLYATALSAKLSGLWEFIGPRPMLSENAGVSRYHNGRIDGFDLSSDAQTIVAGTVGGGIWLSKDSGATWDPVTDPLNQPEFTRVALDPKHPDIVYGLSGSSYSIYKSQDGGKSWSLFTKSLSGAGSTSFRTILARYEGGASDVTLYVADRYGLWVWQGKHDAASAAASEWHHVWQQTRNAYPDVSSHVTDLHITGGSVPQVYLAARMDAVYRTPLASLLAAVAQNKTPTWTPLESGMGISDQREFFIDSSKAKPDRVYVLATRGTACAKDQGISLSLYRLDGASTTWTHVSDPTDVGSVDNICGIKYVAFLRANPANADLLYVGGVPGYRSTDGGKTWPKSNKIPYVHDDYKWAAFNPSDPSQVFFSSDGGIYRCANYGASCDTLNKDLETGMFFDIAVAGDQNRLIIGGTQDNGTQRYDGKLQWKYIRGGDGRFCAIDQDNNDIMYSQHQHAIDTWRSSNGGKSWAWQNVNNGMPSRDDFTGTPYLALHPENSNTVLITAGVEGSSAQVYRTTDGGKNWSPIGPAPAITRGSITRILIDGANDRYYAGSSGGQIWAVKGDKAAANSWALIYDDPTQGWSHEIIMDPDDVDVLYGLFTGWGTGAKRVIELEHTGSTWPGTVSDWKATPIAAGLPTVSHFGGPNGSVRGLALEPSSGNATVLYVGTSRGVYYGRREANSTTWSWALDSCGMPRTYISDIEVHNSGTWLAAATYGRGVYARSAGSTIGTPDQYDQPARNDTLATAATLPKLVPYKWPWIEPRLLVNDLTLDRGDDVDYFKIQMPPLVSNSCLPAGDPSIERADVTQCQLRIEINAPDTPEPFEIALYRSDGSAYLGPTTQSGFNITVERPYDAFADGEVILRIRDLGGCRAKYDLAFYYNDWITIKDVPKLLYDPPVLNRVVPEFGDFPWVFPGDPGLIDRSFVENVGELPEQRVTFPWPSSGDFLATIDIGGGRDLNVTLYNDKNEPIAQGKLLAKSADATVTAKGINVEDLPAGWYALGFSGGTFPTFFNVHAVDLTERILLPAIRGP